MPSTTPTGVINVEALYLANASEPAKVMRCTVVEEAALSLDVEGVGQYTLMWTPTALNTGPSGFTLEDGVLGDGAHPEGMALALGFALSEGLINSLADIRSLSTCPDHPDTVKIQLHHPEQVQARRRDVLITSSCGICGPGEILDDNVLALSEVDTGLTLAGPDIGLLMANMTQQQTIFAQTGGSHAAAIFDDAGNILTVAEDLGRHNALDKAIGNILLSRGDLRGCGAVLSSRLSLEMVLKAVRANLQIVLAASAPTSLAIAVAERFGVTLCAFVREDRATVYTHSHRIKIGDS